MKGKCNFEIFIIAFTIYFKGIVLKLCILLYTLEIMAICHNINFNKIYALLA